MSADWFLDLEDKIFTRVKHNAMSEITEKFSTARFTTSSTNNTTIFPNIYIHELTGSEVGTTLEQTDVNGIMYSIECQVTMNTTREDVKWIMKKLIPHFKDMGFIITSTPIVITDSNMFTAVARFRRNIASADNL